MSRVATSIAIALACCLAALYNHLTCTPGHRIYYDEDVYANMSRNLAAGLGGGVTVLWLPSVKEVERYKWPLGFPALALPWIAAFGTEDGPVILNQWCGIATAALIGFLAFRWTGDFAAAIAAVLLFCLNPIAAGWYRSGSAEPSAVMLALSSLAASDLSASRGPGWVVASLLSALVAVNFRLDNAVLVVPLALSLGARLLTLPRKYVLILIALAAPLVATLVSQTSILGQHYLTARPESRFSSGLILANLASNFRFLLDNELLPFTCAGFAVLLWLAWHERKWLVLLLWVVSQTALLSVYSVGQYSAPGGSRFLLVPSVVLTLSLIGALAKLPPDYRRWMLAASLLGCCLTFPDRNQTWNRLDSINSSPRLEHEAVLRWARALPPGSVVMSDLPYLWESAGVMTAPRRPDISARTSGPLYWHRSLFHSDEPLPPEAPIVGNVQTQHGDVSLVRIR